MVQQHGNDLLGPESLNNSTELGQEGESGTVGVSWVAHNVLAICLYGGTRLRQMMEKE